MVMIDITTWYRQINGILNVIPNPETGFEELTPLLKDFPQVLLILVIRWLSSERGIQNFGLSKAW